MELITFKKLNNLYKIKVAKSIKRGYRFLTLIFLVGRLVESEETKL